MKSDKEKAQQELDDWFDEFDTKPSVYEAMKKESLDDKILRDFHGFAPTIDDKFVGDLPTITPKAQIYISETLKPGEYFRFGVTGGGCSGFNYLLDIDTQIADNDIQFSNNPPALIDSESVKYLYGSEVDLQDHMMNKMLVVKNPSAKASCGCGTSFAVDESLLDNYS
tara:strand:+ start:197 stop:700 length:504 start_codon:yes stop_codon:yes gene_type:complete